MKTKNLFIKKLSLMMMFLFFSALISINAQTAWTPQTYNPDVPGIEMNPMKGLMPGYTNIISGFPYSTDHFYIPLKDVFKARGVYDWAAFETLLTQKGVGGRHVIPRFWVYYPFDEIQGMPDFLITEGVKMYSGSLGVCPDWNDSKLISAFKEFIAAFGAEYDGDPRIMMIEAGLWGSWGEWNTSNSPNGVVDMTVANCDQIATAYKNAFTKTHIALRYGDKLSTTALGQAFGYYDDSYCQATLRETWCFWPTIVDEGLSDIWKTHPLAGEMRPEIDNYIFKQWPNASKTPVDAYDDIYDMEDITTCVTTTHHTALKAYYLYNNAISTTERTNGLKMHKMMGYRFYVSSVKLTPNTNGSVLVDVKLQNTAVAPLCYNWEVEFGAKNTATGTFTVLNRANWDLKGVMPTSIDYDKSATTSVLANGKYKILMRFRNPLLDVGTGEALSLRFANETQDDDVTGWLTLGTADVVIGPSVIVTGVSVAPTTLSIGVGATGQLTPTVLPTNATNKNVTWTSSNTAVATVDANGLVTGKVAGNATITVTTVDQGKTATCAVTVANIPVTSVSVAPTTLSIGVGATGQLTPTVLPTNATNKNVTWLSSNTTVATVVNGLVTAKAQGTANITVTTVDGGKTATCAVTVTTIPTDAIPWNEAFTYANGTTSHGSPTTWTATNMSVKNNEISFNSTTAGVFTTGPINISSGAVTVSVKVRGGTGLDLGQDYLKLYKKVDGGAEVQIAAADGPLAATTWSVDITSGSRVELVLRAYVSATAEYYYFDDLKVVSKTAPVTYTINATAGANGTISPSGSVSVITGASQTFNFTPASGYVVDVVTVNGSAVTPTTSTSHTISNVTANQTINVTFKLAPTTADVTALTDWKLGTTNTKAAGSNRMMVVMVSGESSTTFKANAITYGGQTMTLLTEKSLAGGGSTIYSGVFILKETGVNAATSGAIDVTWSATPSAGSTTYSVLLANVDQTATITKYTKAASSVTSITATSILAPAGSMAIMCGTTASNNTITANNSYTKQFESNSTWGDAVGASKKGTGVNETAKYTQSASSNMVICSFVVPQAPVLKSASIENQASSIDINSSSVAKVYPNPVTTALNIDHAEGATIKIFNNQGQLIYSKSSLGVETTIDVEALNVKGIIMVQVISGQGISVHKVIVR